jgi:hypothetical protein
LPRRDVRKDLAQALVFNDRRLVHPLQLVEDTVRQIEAVVTDRERPSG